MENTKVEQLKTLINKSLLFEVNKESSPVLFKTEQDKLAINLFKLYGKTAQEYGEELYMALLECVKYYDKTKGDFLVLFDMSFKQKIHKNQKANKYQGIKISEKVYAKAKFIYKKLVSSGKTLNDLDKDELDVLCGKELSTKAKNVLMNTLILLYNGESFESITTSREDESGISEESLKCESISIETTIEQEDCIKNLLNEVEDVYNNNVRADTKDMFRIFITRTLIESEIACEKFKVKPYFDEWVYKYFVKQKSLPKNIEIAQYTGKKEEKISSLFKKFREKLQSAKIS